MIFGLPCGIVEMVVGEAVGMGVFGSPGGVVVMAIGEVASTGVFVAGAVWLQLRMNMKSMASVITLFMEKHPFCSVSKTPSLR